MKNKELAKDIKVVKAYEDTPYPPYIHDINLYDSVDFMFVITLLEGETKI